MTALNAAILFNNSTGSDTTASGSSAGANVYGSGASTTSGSAVVTGITTTGVQAGDLLWVQSSSGRQFSVIASVDGGTQVTCDDTFANTESSRTWAIGGKRATFDNADSRQAFQDCVGKGWEFETETNQTVSSVVSVGGGAVDSRTIVKGSTGNELITQTSNDYTFGFGDYAAGLNGDYITFADLYFENTNATKSSSYCFRVDSSYGRLLNVSLVSQTNNHQGLLQRAAGSNHFNFENCTIKHCASHGVDMNRLNYTVWVGCVISDNNGHGIYSNRDIWLIDSCVIANNSQDGVSVNACKHINSIYYGNGGDGVRVYYITPIIGCIFYNNSGYGIEYAAGQPQITMKNNAFGSNTLGATSTTNPYESNSITLTADPFVDAANGDFNLNADAGGGATLRANNFSLNTDTAVYPFRQYVSDAFGAGGGGAVLHPLRSN